MVAQGSSSTHPAPATAVVARLVAGSSPDSIAMLYASQVLGTIPELDIVLLRTPTGSTIATFIRRLQEEPRVLFAEPNYPLETAEGRQSDMAFSEASRSWSDVLDQTALTRIDTPGAHLLAKGDGVVVAILDTGIALDHPMLVDAIDLPGIEPGVTVKPGADHPENVDTNRDGVVDGSLGHGTHVAGIVHAVAPAARLLAVRVLDSDGMGDVFRVARGLVLAAGRGATVANLSLGLAEFSRTLQAAVDRVRSEGVVVVAAAGNAGAQTLDFPASYPPVIAVAGTLPDDHKAEFSDYGDAVDVAAPAVGILSTYWDGTYARWSGTSMAAPFVSGISALLYGRLGAASPATAAVVQTLVRAGAVPLMAVDSIYGALLGSGRVNAAASVRRLPPDGPEDEGERPVQCQAAH